MGQWGGAERSVYRSWGDGVGYGTGTVYRSRITSRALATTGRNRTMTDVRHTLPQDVRPMTAPAEPSRRYRPGKRSIWGRFGVGWALRTCEYINLGRRGDGVGKPTWWRPITRGRGGFSVTVAVTAAVAYASMHLVGTSNAPSLQGSTSAGPTTST